MLEYMYRSRVSLRSVFSSAKLYFSLFIYLKKDPVDPGLRFGLSRDMVYLSYTRFREILYNALKFFFTKNLEKFQFKHFATLSRITLLLNGTILLFLL